MGNIKDKVAVVGMGCSKFGENWDKSPDDMIIEATYEALEDSGIDHKDIEAAWLGTAWTGFTGSALSRSLKFLDRKPITRVENACSSGAEAIRGAALAIASGMYDIAIAVGVDKLKDTGFSGLPAMGDEHPVYGMGATGPGLYASAATRYFHKYNISPEEGKRLLAMISVKNHHNGSLSPKAMFRKEVTVERVLNAPIIAWPLGLFDCCPTTDGAAVAILTRADMAKSFRDDYVLIKGMGVSIGQMHVTRGQVEADFDFTFWNESYAAAKQAYEQAGVKNPRQEISMAEVHDCFTITELINYESLDFCPRGKAKEDVDAGTFTLEGDLPVNTDGGLKAFGHPVGASGIRMAYECYKQLQGKAGPRQVKNPRLGLAHCQGGNPGAFQCTVNLFGSRD